MKRLNSLLLIGFLAAVGCNQCGDRPRLLSRRDNSADNHAPAPNCALGQPVGSSSGTGFGNPAMGYPVANSGPIYTGPSLPSYPQGDPLPYPSRPDELPPPGGYIPSPGVPSAPYAIPKSVESGRVAPKAGLTTGGK
jgi:hypothetical protein